MMEFNEFVLELSNVEWENGSDPLQPLHIWGPTVPLGRPRPGPYLLSSSELGYWATVLIEGDAGGPSESKKTMILRSICRGEVEKFNSIVALSTSIFSLSASFSSSSLAAVSTSPLPNQAGATTDRLNHKDWLTPKEVLKIVEQIRDPDSLVAFLDHYSKRKDYCPNEAIYTSIISRLAQARRFDEIENVMQRIKAERNCRLSDEFFYHVIKTYGNDAGRINRAMKTLFDMPDYNCWPTVKIFNYVLNLLVSAKLFDFVHEVYLSAPKLGIEIDACCLNILIKGLCERGNLEAAFYVLDEFPKQKCRPNVRTFSTLMHGLCAKGKVDEAFELLERMEKERVSADTVTFNILISGLRKHGRVEEAIGVLEKMKLKGCYPNDGSYNEILYGLLDEKRFIKAKELMGMMILERFDPSFVSYKKLISGLCEENRIEDLDWVLKKMVKQGFLPKMGMWRQIIQCVFSATEFHSRFPYKELVES